MATASTSAEAVQHCRRSRPDVTLVDVDLGDESGFDVARLLSAETSGAVVLISTYAGQDLADLIEASPAVGYLSKLDLSGGALAELLDRTSDHRR